MWEGVFFSIFFFFGIWGLVVCLEVFFLYILKYRLYNLEIDFLVRFFFLEEGLGRKRMDSDNGRGSFL